MALAVCLHNNIFDEGGEMRLRGEAFEASEKWIAEILAGDEDAGRQARIVQVETPQPKRGRPKKVRADEAE